MADSSAAKKRTVKVLLYGQSVTQEIWSTWVGDFLRQSYPNANVVVANLAIGYQAEQLNLPAQIDIPTYYPDLMIFQDYGYLPDFEKIVALARRQTTADILIQTDHINHPEDLNELTDPNEALSDRAWRNYVFLPGTAVKYGAELGDVRTYWKRYLKDYNIPTEQLLRDQIHPNTQGSFLMSKLVESYLRVDRSFPSDNWMRCEENFTIGEDVHWTNEVLQVEFTGNRVDVISEGNGAAPVEVRIDGKRPSELPELYHFTRADWYPNTLWLTILQVNSRKPLLEENWTARILTFTTNNGVPFATFAVSGSLTGPDGSGSITQPFVSQSGRVAIDPADWLMIYWAASYYPIVPPLSPGFEIHWTSRLEGKDSFVPQVPDPTIEAVTTLAQGLANGPHTLILRRQGTAPISKIRAYNPLARVQPEKSGPWQLLVGKEIGQFTVQMPPLSHYVLEDSADCVTWQAASGLLSDPVLTISPEGNRRFYRIRPID